MKMHYTIGLVATLSLLAACGSKKQKPVEAKTAPVAEAAPLNAAEFDGSSVACSNGEVNPEKMQSIEGSFFTTTKNNEYTWFMTQQGSAVTEKGTFEIVLANPKDSSTGKLILTPTSRVAQGKQLIQAPPSTVQAPATQEATADSATKADASKEAATKDAEAKDAENKTAESKEVAPAPEAAVASTAKYEVGFTNKGDTLTLMQVDVAGTACAKGETVSSQYKRVGTGNTETPAPSPEAVSTSK